MYILKEDLMKKRVLSLFMVLVLCLTLLPTAAFAEGEDVSISGGVIGGGETGGEGGGIYVAPGSPTEGGGGTYIPGEDTQTEIWCVSKPDSIGRGYDGTTDGGTIPIDLTFTDGTNEIKLKEGTGFTAKKTFDSADAGWHTVTVEIELIGEAAVKYKLKAGEETFTIGGNINKAYPDLTVTLSKTACTAGEKLLPLLSVEGAPEDAEVTYYYLASALKNWAGSSEVEGSEAMPKIDENTAISEPGTYYVYAKTAETKNYEEERSATVELTVNEAVVEAASITKADGTAGGTYKTLPAALDAAQDGDTVKLLADHTTNWSDVEAGEYATLAVVRKTLTLDLNGMTVDYLTVGEVVSDEDGGILDSYDGNLTVVDNIQGGSHGKIKDLKFVKGSLAIQGGRIGDNDGSKLTCDGNSGTVTISGGTVYNATVGDGATVTVSGGTMHQGEWVNNGTLNIKGGTFGAVNFHNNSGTIAISGGTFSTLKNYDNTSPFPIAPISLLAPGHAFYKDNTVQDGSRRDFLQDVTVKEHTHTMVNNKCACGFSCTHTNTEGASTIDKNGKCTVCGTQFAAGIGETYYTDVPSALNAAADGQTIKLLANTMLPDGIYASKTLTLDLDGHSLDGYSLNVGGLTPTGQALTGNLTVIDSSGGNGAVGVTVRDGGTLVFDPKNDHTTLLQLEVWGGTVELYGGKISRSGLRLNNNITLGNLLPGQAGLAYYRGDTQLTLEEAASQTCDLVVKSCSHGGKNGFDNNSTACPYCGAPAVAETALNNGEGNRLQRRFADLQTALDADRDGGATLKLLTDVTGDYTIDGTQDTGLNLNGHSIKGTVTVKAAAGSNTTTLSNTKNTTTASIDKVVAYKGAKLAGSGKPAVIGELTLADGATWKNILNLKTLGYKVLNGDGTYKWYAPDDVKGSQLNNVIINSLPITSKTLNLKVDGKNLTGNSPKVERGTTVQLCASCNAKGVTVTFSILKTGETTPITLTEPSYSGGKYTKDYSFDTIGEYTIYFTATKDGYTVQSAKKKLTVTKPNLSNAEITFRSSNESTYEPYRSTTTAPGFTVTYNGKTLKLGVDYTASGTASSAGVSTQTLTIKAVEGSDYTGSKTAEWRIVPHKAKVEVGDVIKAYDGTTDLPDGKISLVSAAGSAGYQAGLPLPLSEGNGFELTDAKYDSANASETEKNISFTVKLTDTNYTFEDGTTEKAFTLNGADFDDKTFQINKATIASDTQLHQTVFNDLKKTYEIDLNQVLDKILPEGGTYGDIKYGRPGVSMYADYYPAGGANIENGKLRLSINKAASFKQGKEIGTVTVQVETTNYQPFTLTIHVSVQDKLVPVPAEGNSVSATDIIYGQTLADSKLTVNGTMQDSATGAEVKGTFAWTDGTIKPDANDRYEAEWTFTPAAGYEKYATVTGTVTIKVKPAKLIVSVKASSMYYTGEEQIASIIASGQSVDSTPVTFTYSDKVDGNYTSGVPTFTDAGTYTAYYKAEAANHEPVTGTFTVTIDPLPISLLSVSSISKTYDGSADVTLTADKLTFFSKTAKATNIKLPDTAITFTNARFTKKQADGSYLPSPEVGGGKALSFTMMLTSNNYVFEGKSKGTTEVSDVFATDDANRFTITKAAAPSSSFQPAVTVINDLAKTYEMVLFSDYLPKLSSPCEYGTVSYSLRGTYLTDGYKDTVQVKVMKENSQYKLKLTVPAVDYDKVSSVGTIDVRVTSDNYRDFYLTIGVKTKNKDVPVPDGTISASDITYGQALNDSKIAGKMKAGGKAIDGTFTWTNGTFKPAAGDYPASWTFTPAEGYEEYATATGTVTIKVAPKSIEGATITLKKREFTYNAAEQSPTITGVMLKGWSETITTYDIVSGDKAINANDSITLTIKGTGNYTGTATAEWKIIPAKLTVSVPSEVKKEYDGTTNATVTPTFNGLRGKDNLTAADYSVTAAFDNAKVGYKKTVIGKVTLNQTETAKNYVLTNDGNFSTDDGTITKAVAPTVQPVELTIYNGVQADYYVDLPSLPDMGKGKSYGTVGYRKTHTINLSEGYKAQSDLRADPENLNTLRLLLHMTQTGSLTGEIGTVTIPVTTSNYQDITLTVKISAKNRITPTGTPTLSKNAIIYGDALNTIALSGKLHDNVNNVDVDGTFEWVDGTHIPAVGNGTYAAEWIFEPTDTEKYLTVSGRSNITVEKARQYGKLSMAGYTYGKTPSTPTLTDQTGDLNAQVTYSYAAADSGSVQT